jgi:dihydrofolate reductase
MITLITILSITVVILGYTTFNLLRKIEKQEDMLEQQNKILVSYQSYLNKISDTIEVADKKLQEVDQRGSFKADDEIGFVFEQIKMVQTILNAFIIKELK